MNEIYVWRQKLSDLKNRQRRARAEAQRLVLAIRMELNPFEEDPLNLNMPDIVALVSRLDELIQEMKDTQKKISEIEKALNG